MLERRRHRGRHLAERLGVGRGVHEVVAADHVVTPQEAEAGERVARAEGERLRGGRRVGLEGLAESTHDGRQRAVRQRKTRPAHDQHERPVLGRQLRAHELAGVCGVLVKRDREGGQGPVLVVSASRRASRVLEDANISGSGYSRGKAKAMNHPPNYGYRPPAPPPSGGPSVLLIVLVVLIVALVLGGGGCLLCIGLSASTADSTEPPITTTTTDASVPPSAVQPAPTPTPSPALQPTPTPTRPSLAPRAPVAKKRVVDFACPQGKKAGGAVRAGCVCGDEILGTACGAPGNFTDVTETPTGCRFVCD